MSKTLLLADDSVVIQKLVGLSFANEDVEIVSTDNGDDAVLKAREIRPDVVLADVVMPGKSGYEVCEAIKQDPSLAHIPVLLLTGTFEAFDESRATGAGADGHITKPFEAQALVERVKTVIKNARPPAPAPVPAADPIAAPIAASIAAKARTSAPVPTADDLFDEVEEATAPPAGRSALFGRPESLDVTPSLSEDDLDDALDVDLFGPPGGDVGGPSLAATLGTARSASLGSTLGSTTDSGRTFAPAPAAPERFAETAIEDATIAMLPESPVAVAANPPALADDLGFDDPIEVHELPLASFDLDSAFDPAPPAATTSLLELARDDANAATSRSLDRPSAVADLDEILATPVRRPATPPPLPRAVLQPEQPTAIPADRSTGLDLGAPARTVSDLDFGFDVSEQAPISQVDLLAESFSSLLDVSESQLLGDPAPTRPPAPTTTTTTTPSTPSTTAPRSTPPPIPVAARPAGGALLDSPSGTTQAPIELLPATDFDVSSSDLATAGPIFAAKPASTAPIAAPATPAARRPSTELDDFMPTGALLPDADFGPVSSSTAPASSAQAASVASPRPTSASPALDRSAGATNAMSPILQQQVQETLEKVAWEAFSDLSETIVKQVIERIERIAWEVIPQMAETLIREEIRQLKGEED